jgi:purine-binding chemotaxis protein CheW
MNTSLANPSQPSSVFPSNQGSQSLSKFLLFQVGKLNLALSVALVQKVIHYTPIFGSGLSSIGVAHIGEQEITVIDLHKRFFKTREKLVSGQKGYLILSRIKSGEILALWVAQTPTLIDVPLSQIRTLPESYRRGDTLDIASHVMLIPHREETMTVFVLDLDEMKL